MTDYADPYFPLPLVGRVIDHGKAFVTSTRFIFVDGDRQVIEVPPGFRTDWNSAPRGTWNLFAPMDYAEAGLIHDAVYRDPCGRSRKDADQIHRRILEVLGCPWWKRHAAYVALRLGGWRPWNQYRSEATHAQS